MLRRGGKVDVLGVWNAKGGVGKTTLCLQLAGFYTYIAKKKVLVVDLDPQKSAFGIYHAGKLGFDVTCEAPAWRPPHDLVLIDHPPGVQALPKTGHVLVPFQPNVLAYKPTLRVFKYLERKGQRVIKVLTCVDRRKKEHRQVLESLDADVAVVHNRAIYERSLGRGYTVFHGEATALYGVQPARDEIAYLAGWSF